MSVLRAFLAKHTNEACHLYLLYIQQLLFCFSIIIESWEGFGNFSKTDIYKQV